MRQVVARRDHLPVTLSASFRNVPALIGWLNDRFERLLGTPPDGRPFDSDTGRVFHQADELFALNSWVQVMMGQGITPQAYHPVADLMGQAELANFLGDIELKVSRTVAGLPGHQAYVEQLCAPYRNATPPQTAAMLTRA